MTAVATPATRSIVTADGTRIAATRYEPARANGRVVIVNSGTGIRRRFYHPFAIFLRDHGFVVWTYDYRGIGESPWSGPPHELFMHDWGEQDLAAVIDRVRREHPDQRMLALGHSVGGQILGLTDRNRHVAGMLGIAAQSGYWEHWDGTRRYLLRFLWSCLMPGVTRVAGRYPGRWFGGPFDLPAGIALEWARWCRTPGFIPAARPGHAVRPFGTYDGHIRFCAFTDDPWAPRRAVRALMACFPSARSEYHEIAPHQVGVERIGHVGFFRPTHRHDLWTEAARWLAAA